MIEGSFEEYILMGMEPEEYLGSSFAELELYGKKKVKEKKNKLQDLQTLAILIAGTIFPDKDSKEPITIYKLYPDLFKEDLKEAEEELEEKQRKKDVELQKARMDRIMMINNNNRKKKGGG